MKPSRRTAPGFTLIELMLVVAIIGLLSAIAIPKFANLVDRAREASLRGGLGALRSALSIYYADNEGRHPWFESGTNLLLCLEGKYIDKIPTPRFPSSLNHEYKGAYRPSFAGLDCTGVNVANGILTACGAVTGPFIEGRIYLYGITPPPVGSSAFGGGIELHIDCWHTDTKGTTWSNY